MARIVKNDQIDQYIRKIQFLKNPSFQQIRNIATESISGLSKEKKENLRKQLNRGIALLNSHEELCEYLDAYGEMHEAKIQRALETVPKNVFKSNFIVIDWGCGQGLATICFFDFLKNQKIEIQNNIQKVILIEASKRALERAELHVNAYMRDKKKVQPLCKYLNDIIKTDIEIPKQSIVLHFFSNILDIPQIDLGKIAKLLGENTIGEQYIFCIGPLYYWSKRIDAFCNYFNNPFIISNEEISCFSTKKWTLKLKVFKLEKNKTYYFPYPIVRFHAGYQLDCVNSYFNLLPQKQQNKAKDLYKAMCSFEISAPFNINANIYDDIHSIYAVINNIIVRGLPTKASLFIEEQFAFIGNKRKKNDLGSIVFENENLDHMDLFSVLNLTDIAEQQQVKTFQTVLLSPIAIARIQKIVLEALITGRLRIEQNEWEILIVEHDMPCGALAFEDLRQMFDNVVVLSKDYCTMKFPKINLEIISTIGFVDSPLHLKFKPIVRVTNQQKSKIYDMIIDISMLKQVDFEKILFSEFQYKNECYFNIRSTYVADIKKANTDVTYCCQLLRSNRQLAEIQTRIDKHKQGKISKYLLGTDTQRVDRHIYTSDIIEYKSLVRKDSQGRYIDIEKNKIHLRYFLQLLFRKEDFRPGQLPILNRVLQNKCVIGLLPTGGGKSLTYQLAAMLQPGVTIIVDPLRALMKDQYEGLLKAGIDTCTFINSTIENKEKEKRAKQMESSQMQFVFLSPERLCIYAFREYLKMMHNLHIYFAYGVIDEVHCVSEWGHDFRTSYLHLGRNIYKYVKPKKGNISLLGLTATASFDVLADVERELSGNGIFKLDEDAIVKYENIDRLELQYKVEKVPTTSNFNVYKEKQNFLKNYISKIPELINELQTEDAIRFIKSSFKKRQNSSENLSAVDLSVSVSKAMFQKQDEYKQAGIVFCPHVKNTGISVSKNKESLGECISNIGTFVGSSNEDEELDKTFFANLESFRDNKLPLMVATNALGMGIDKPNVRFVVNMNYPNSLESFVQEAGRAGRDKKIALAVILFSDQEEDYRTVMYFHDKSFKGKDLEKEIMNRLLSQSPTEIFYTDDEEVKKTNIIPNFLDELLNLEINAEIVAFIPYRKNDEVNDISKAIYRMCCIELIDDFTIDYGKKRYRIVARRKKEGEYYQKLKCFLMRYYSEEKAEQEIKKAYENEGKNEIYKCLDYLINFIYEKIAKKRKRAIDDMKMFCDQGSNDTTKNWKVINEDLKDFIYYYFNSKYARKDYETEKGEPFSLTTDTNRGKTSSFDILFKYLRVVDEDVYGSSGSPKDNVKHLQGAVRLIRHTLPETNASLSMLDSFCLSYLNISNNETLNQEMENSYKEGYEVFRAYSKDKIIFYKNIGNYINKLRLNYINEKIVLDMEFWGLCCELSAYNEWLNNFKEQYAK